MSRLDELERKFEESPHRYFASLANEYRKGGEPQRAAEMCRTQLAAIPGHISGHIVLGQALYDSGDFAESRTALERALTLDPENIVALRYLGDIARDTGDVPGAERWYTRTLEADPYNEAAAAALKAMHAPALVDSAEIVSVAEAETPPVEPIVEEIEPVVQEIEPIVSEVEPVVSDIESIVPEIEPAETVDGYETAQSTDDGGLVADSAPEPAAEGIMEDTLDPEPAAAEPMAEPAPEPARDAVVEDEASPIPVPAMDETPEPEPVAAAEAHVQQEIEQGPSPETIIESGEFAADLEISAAGETAVEEGHQPPAQDVAVFETKSSDEPVGEPVDVAAHPLPEPVTIEELIRTEERVMESAAPFVTETMADLYLEQGYPHEALELLLQLFEQRPDDAQLRDKIGNIESVIAARRDAAVAAARAERAEAAEALAAEPPAAPEPPAPPPPPRSVRELFARMDSARPRVESAGTPISPSRLRSDFVPLPVPGEPQPQSVDDPFGFPDTQPAPPTALPAKQPGVAPRTSGPHPTFDPSTAELAEFDAWLRGLRGP